MDKLLEIMAKYRIVQETRHSPEAVDNYILDFARVYFATVKRRMTPEETAFAIRRPLYLVQEYVNLIQEFGMDEQRIYDRSGIDLVRFKNAGEEPEALPQPAALALDSPSVHAMRHNLAYLQNYRQMDENHTWR